MQTPNPDPQIHGTVADGFESVKELFSQQMRSMAERQAQLCVYHRGQRVVDLWADMTGEESGYSPDSLSTVFSSGKSLEAIAVAAQVDQGRLQYDAPIPEYWPEFAANGKADITVADLMRHEAGMANFDRSLDLADLFRENIKDNRIGPVIEQQTPRYRSPDSKREYHALTRGWIVNELFRRVDASGRTIGEFLSEEIAGPLEAGVKVGLDESDRARFAQVEALGMGYQLRQSMVPRRMGRPIVHNFWQLSARLARAAPMLFNRRNAPPPPFTTGATPLSFFSNPDFARGETPSANASCSARGLAKVAAMMAARGTFDGKTYIGSAGWDAMHDKPAHAHMGGLLTTNFTQGGVDQYQSVAPGTPALERAFNQGREGFVGWMGFGGSIFQWHPELDIGFAFVPTSLHVLDLLNERGKRYQAEVISCIK